MSCDLMTKCRTCLCDSHIFHQLNDYVDENYIILEMLDGIVPQIDIKTSSNYSSLVCQSCVDKLVAGYKFQQLCIETNKRLHDLMGFSIFETAPLTGEATFKMKIEIGEEACFECELNPEKLEESSGNDSDWVPAHNTDNDTDSSNEKLSVLKERKTQKSSSKSDEGQRPSKNNRRKEQFPCSECGKVIFAEKTFKAHMLTHENEDINQSNVEVNNERKDENNIDIKEQNYCKENYIVKGTQKFQCSDCAKCFEKKAFLSSHYRVHTKKIKNKLNKDTNNGDDVDIDDSDDNSEKNAFTKPGAMGEIEKPNSSIKRSNFPCEVCGKVFDRPYHLKRHSSVHSITKPHECKICKYRFDRVNNLNAHMVQHDGLLMPQSRPEGFKCPDCPRRFKIKASLSAHRQIHTRNSAEANYPCMVCQRNFMSVRSLTEHIINKHPEVEKHKCGQCDKTFVLHDHLVEHLNCHKGNKNLVCLICEKELGNTKSWKEHMRTHSGESPYLCPQCGKTIRRASSFREHMERHRDLKKYQCPKCPLRFNCRSDLMKHTSTHTNAKPHVCDLCGSRFTRTSSLRKHKLLHSGERPFKCDQCSMKFIMIYQLRSHMRTHTGEKPHKCKYCKRAYAEGGDLTRHLRTHVGEYTYMCDQCPMAFKKQPELKQHQSEHYKMDQKLAQHHQQLPLPTNNHNQQIIIADQNQQLTIAIPNHQQMALVDHHSQQLPRIVEQTQQLSDMNEIARLDNIDINNLPS